MAHAKQKGNLGEMAVAKDLIRQGYHVFTELGDLSKVDLIALDPNENTLIKIQVKYRAMKDGVVKIAGKKSGPNYNYKYCNKDCDVFAVYCPDVDQIAYISIDLVSDGKTICLRITEPLNKQKDSRYFKNYTNLKREPSEINTHTTVTDNADGDEGVQTYNFPKKKRKKAVRKKKIEWPSNEKLLSLLENHSFRKLGTVLGVSDNAIRKHLKSNGVDWKSLGN